MRGQNNFCCSPPQKLLRGVSLYREKHQNDGVHIFLFWVCVASTERIRILSQFAAFSRIAPQNVHSRNPYPECGSLGFLGSA